MANVTITEALDMGNDVLLVRGTVDDITEPVLDDGGNPTGETRLRVFDAQGWVSAMTNHYDPESIDPQTGQRKDGTVPREMTGDERRAYATALLVATAGVREGKAISL